MLYPHGLYSLLEFWIKILFYFQQLKLWHILFVNYQNLGVFTTAAFKEMADQMIASLSNKGVGSRMPIIGPVHWQ